MPTFDASLDNLVDLADLASAAYLSDTHAPVGNRLPEGWVYITPVELGFTYVSQSSEGLIYERGGTQFIVDTQGYFNLDTDAVFVAYNTERAELAVVFRGTEFNLEGDIATDLAILAGELFDIIAAMEPLTDAAALYADLHQLLPVTTGHSLGGGLAEVLAATDGRFQGGLSLAGPGIAPLPLLAHLPIEVPFNAHFFHVAHDQDNVGHEIFSQSHIGMDITIFDQTFATIFGAHPNASYLNNLHLLANSSTFGEVYPGLLNGIVFADRTDIYFEGSVPSSGTRNFVGTPSNDVITAEPSTLDFRIEGYDGYDRIFGASGNDQISGGNDIDQLYGGAGNDVLHGDRQSDYLTGGMGNDRLVGGEDGDFYIVRLGEGHDTIADAGGGEIDALWIYGGSVVPTADKLVYTVNGNDLSITARDAANNLVINVTIEGMGTATNQIETLLLFGPGGALVASVDLPTQWHNPTPIAIDTIHGNPAGGAIYGTSNTDYIIGSAYDDMINAGAGYDYVFAGGGNDRISAGDLTGNYLDGGDGNDYYYGSTNDTIVEDLDEGYDTVALENNSLQPDSVFSFYFPQNVEEVAVLVNAGQLIIHGDVFDNVFGRSSVGAIKYGYGGNDTFTFHATNNQLIGGFGDDTYAIYATAEDGPPLDHIVELANQGTDLIVVFSAGPSLFVLPDNIENLSAYHMNPLDGRVQLNVLGNDLDNVIRGDVADDTINGGGGDDTLYSGSGEDTIYGGAGADTIFASGKGHLYGGEGIDTVDYSDATNLWVDLEGQGGGSAHLDEYDSIENVIGSSFNDVILGDDAANDIRTGTGDDLIEGRGGPDRLIAGEDIDTLSYEHAPDAITINLATGLGTQGDADGDEVSGFERVRGSEFGDNITGSTGIDYIQGGGGNDILTGGAGADVLDGGSDFNTAAYDNSAAVDVDLTRNTMSGGDAAGDSFYNIQNIRGSANGDLLAGNDAANTIEGLDGGDTINGRGGDDWIYGGGGADTIAPGSGADHIYGGDGIDTVDYSDTSGVLVDLEGQGGFGAHLDVYDGIENIIGSGAADTILGDDSANEIRSGDSGDLVEGRGGADQLFGEGGIDTLSYEHAPGAITINLATGLGTQGDANGDGVSGFERVRGSEYDDDIIGSAGDDYIQGGSGNDILTGGLGADVLDGGPNFLPAPDFNTVAYDHSSAAVDVDLTRNTMSGGDAAGDSFYNIQNIRGSANGDLLAGDNASNTIEGLDGSDTINGRGGNDRMSGGAGGDTYYVDTMADLIFENSGNGTDLVHSTTSFYLYANVEDLMLAEGSGDLFGVGNELANVITGNSGINLLIGGGGGDTLTGGDGADLLFGEAGVDTLFGGAGIDYLVGGTEADTLDGGADADALYGQDGNDSLNGGAGFVTDILVGGDGNDTLYAASGFNDYDLMDGGAGDDTYYVDTGADLTFEASDGGIDRVYANVSNVPNAGVYLYANLEHLVLVGTTAFGVGNELANTLTGSASGNWLLGGAGYDMINGKEGNDVLFGEAGNDTFVFELGSGGDVIGDFTHGEDTIDVTDFGFGSFEALQANFVQVGTDGAINLGGTDFIVLHNVTMATLDAGDFAL